MNGILLIAIALLLTNGVFAASTCGRGSLRIKFGQTKTFTPPDMTKGNCKYRIRAGIGMNIRLTFDEYDPTHGLTLYNGEKPFKWRSATRLRPLPRNAQPSGLSVVYPVDTVAMKLDFSSGNTPISFTYESVLPSHGSFGYDLKAKSKLKTYRTPGYPKTLLPNFVQSTWDIIAEEGEMVYLKFLGYDIDPDTDYIEVRDGGLVLQTYTGKKGRREVAENYGPSGRMTILLRIRGPNSKGFKIKYQSIASNLTEPATTTPPIVPGQPLRCHRRNRVISKGLTLSDDYSSMTCASGEICGRMVINGTSSQYRSLTISSETLNCIPRNLCTESADPCSTMPPPPAVTVKGCNVACCDTDMCNKSPDGPDVPPSPQPGVSTPPPFTLWPGQRSGPHCNQESEVKVENRASLGSASGGGPPCSGVCALYEFEGTSDGNAAKGYSAACVPEDQCNEAACHTLPDTSDIDITSCNVSCCSTDYCNERVLSELPSPFPTEPPISCYNIRFAKTGDTTLVNERSVVDCRYTGLQCGRVEATTVDDSGRTITAAFGQCISETYCETLGCDVLQEFMPVGNIQSCDVRCCKGNLCNDNAGDFVSKDKGTLLQCHRKSETVREGAIGVGDHRYILFGETYFCPEDEVCGLYIYYGTSTDQYQLGEPYAGQVAKCTSRANCTRTACQNLKQADNIDVNSCQVSCCNTDLCNEPQDTPMPSPPPGSVSSCYEILSSRAGDIDIMNEKSVTTCGGYAERCFRIDATATDNNTDLEVTTAYGGCMSAYSCSSLDCGMIANVMPNIKLKECSARCCATDLCNEEKSSTVTITPRPDSRVICYERSEIMRPGVLSGLAGSDEETSPCPSGNLCGLFIFDGSDNTGPASGYVATCVPQSKCNLDGCSSLPATQGIDITSCRVSCCNGDKCNVPPTDIPTPSPSPSTGAVRQCYDILSTRVGTTQALDKRSPMACEEHDARCMRLDAVATDAFENEVTIAFGRCVPAASCSTIDCNLMTPSMPGIDVTACNAQCCDSELCNGEPLQLVSLPSITTTTSGTDENRITCYEVIEMHGMGMRLPGSSRKEKLCDPNSKCLSMKAVASHKAFSGIKLTTTYGSCITGIACDYVDCSSLPTAMDGVTISDCTASCCDTDLCNG